MRPRQPADLIFLTSLLLKNDSYVQYGFTKVIRCDKLDNAQCILCNTILGNDSLKPSKLKRHKELKHKENTDNSWQDSL